MSCLTRCRLLRCGTAPQRFCLVAVNTRQVSTCGLLAASSPKCARASLCSPATLRLTRSSRSSGMWNRMAICLHGADIHPVFSAHPMSRTGLASHRSPTSSPRSPSGVGRMSQTLSPILMKSVSTCLTRYSYTTPLAAFRQNRPSSTPTLEE